MNIYQLGVAVKDSEYLRRLAEYIRDSKLGEQWKIIAFTHAEACKQYIQQGYKLDVLAAQPDLLAEVKPAVPKLPVIALVHKLGESGEEHELHQYQPLPQLLQRLSEIHAQAAPLAGQAAAVADEPSEGARVLSVYSSSGGTGKTALALHLTHAASIHRFRTFYLNLERWNSSEAWLGTYAGKEVMEGVRGTTKHEGLSELLYSLKTQPAQAAKWLLEHRKRDARLGGDYLAVCTNLEDRLTLCEEDAGLLIEAISASGQYDLIIVDLDSDLEGMHIGLFEKSHRILWLMNDSASARLKQSMVLRYGEQKWNGRFNKLLSKIIYVHKETIRDELARNAQEIGQHASRLQLPEIADWRGAGNVQLLSSPLYRAAADQLFKQLFLEGAGAVAER
ncbi:hypothetical protein [Paenibacillus sinopodophylli]|uniref:hypothetical protein n=1 Tax=Paenibacillus sinopodophylli TaxID=1837342 RepID=UPI001486257C|nr:hypothetical protein [Paenibacillus sinopodophylli]